jgi:hypothetical protein
VARPKRIAWRYLKSWFFIDFVSCIPLQYFYLTEDGGGADCEAAGDVACKDTRPPDDLRVAKVVRLLRLSKMLRLARIKKLMAKYQQSFTFHQGLGAVVVISAILFMSHLLCCFWHMLGQIGEVEDAFIGWVIKMERCNCNAGFGDCEWQPTSNATVLTPCWDDATGTGERYITSLYLVFNSLEPIYETTAEKAFALVAGVMFMPIIYGAISPGRRCHFD